MHVLAFFGILAIVLARIVHPPTDPVQPQVNSAAQLAPEQRARVAAVVPAGPTQKAGDLADDLSPETR